MAAKAAACRTERLRIIMIHVLLAFGTRPEAVKLAPVIAELKARPEVFRVSVCFTSQHRELLRQVTDFFGIREDVDLDVMISNQERPATPCEATVALPSRAAAKGG